ncbi:MAG: hypothetical protein ABIK43_07350, partial [candidate division WOR-3 bacterium]
MLRLRCLFLAVLVSSAVAGTWSDNSCPAVISGNGGLPPTDDSLWVLLDSVYIGSPPSTFWRGLRVDPNGVHAWMMGGDGNAIVQKRLLANGSLVSSFTTSTSSPYDIVRFSDSLCIAYYGSSQLMIYDTLGNYGRSISTPSGLRGVEWDGSKFWVTSVNNYYIYTISRGGTLLRTLTPTVNPQWMGVIALDRTYPNRLWISNGTSTINNVHYCSFDTAANTYTILATFSHPCNSYVGGLSFVGPGSGGSYMWVLVRSGQYLWRYRVHDPLNVHDVGCTKVLVPSGTVDSGVPVTPACSVYNYGTNTESYRVRLRIGSYTDTARVTNHAVGTRVYVEFPQWIPTQRGGFTASCSTELTGDMSPANDKASASGTVRVTDVAALSIAVPSGSYPAGASITPAATWKNNGTGSVGFQAWMCLNDPAGNRVYAQKVDVSNLNPGAQIYISSFPSFVLSSGGTWTVRCSTFCNGDLVRQNDTLDRTFTVGNPDIGVLPIVAPSGRIDTGTTVVPEGRVRNYGDISVPFRAWFIMKNPSGTEVYREYLDIPGLSVNTDTNLHFPSFHVGSAEGNWTTRCSVYAVGDGNPNNDFRNGSFTVSSSPSWPYGWYEMEPMPSLPSGKPCKDGAWLARVGRILYAAKGNKTGDFYSFDPEADSDGVWTELPPIPNGTEAKPPYRGAVGVGVATGGYVYATKGNNTLGFWRYDIDSMVWRQMPDVPLGPSGKKVKGGTDMVYFRDRDHGDTGYIYLLKGYKTDFFRFNTVTLTWDTTLPEAPVGAKAKWDKGSWLVYHRYAAGQTYFIYAHKANETKHSRGEILQIIIAPRLSFGLLDTRNGVTTLMT